MTYTTDRAEFIRQMGEEFANHGDFENIPDPPTPEQVRRLFQYLRGRQADIEIAFRSYTNSFYIARRGVYVSYPGGVGETCDSWSEVLWGQRIGNKYVIDCDGYAVIAVELMMEAGYRFVEYIYAFEISDDWELGNSHILAKMRLNSATLFISNDTIYNSLADALGAIGWVKYIFSTGQTVYEAWIEAQPMIEDIQNYRMFVENPRELMRKMRRFFQ